MSTLPIPAEASADTYTDFSGLQALKRAAAKNDPSAVRKVAQQFESMFTRMMLKSMREAVGTDPIFGSDQEKMYQGMYDDQLALQMSKGRGLGLADMLVRQLQRLGVPGAGAASGASGVSGTAAGLKMPAVGAAPLAGKSLPAASATTQQNFIQGMWPQAQQAGASARRGSDQPHRAVGAGNQLGPQSAPRWQRSFQQQSLWGQGHRRLGGSQHPGRDHGSRPATAQPARSRRSARTRTPPRAFRTMYRSCATIRVTRAHSIPAATLAPLRPGCSAAVTRLTPIMSARSAPSPTTSPATWP